VRHPAWDCATLADLNPPMAYSFYAGLSNADTADIIAYLRTLK
jgi:hypothetical protein